MQRVTVVDENLDWISSHHAVLQGTVLGLLLFNLYVNDLKLKLCEINQYADNTVLLTSHSDLDDCKKSPEYLIEDILHSLTSLHSQNYSMLLLRRKNFPQS